MMDTEKDFSIVETEHVSGSGGPGGLLRRDVAIGFVPKDEDEFQKSKTVNRRLDMFLLPFMAALYLFSGLDRSNIGNAQTVGFTKDLGIPADSLNTAVSLFYATFVPLQPVSAGIGKKVGPHLWMPIIMFCWGIFVIANAFVKNYASLVALRLCIGVFEAGFYPTACLYLSSFYPRYDLAFRIGLFYGMYAISGAFGGAIAYGVFKNVHGSLFEWQYLFIIEGCLTSGMALLCFFVLPKGPSTAWFLSKEQKEFAKQRMIVDSVLSEETNITKADIIETILDWKTWYVLFFNILASVPSQAFGVFLPLVVEGLGFSGIRANLMSVPPYILGACGLWIFTFSSDHFRERGIHIIVCLVISLVGFIMVILITNDAGRYVSLCILTFGSYGAAPLTIAWIAGNTPMAGKRSLCLGILGWGNLAGIIGSELFNPKFAPRYLPSFYACLGIIIVTILGYISYRIVLGLVNTRRRNATENWTSEEVHAEELNEKRKGDKKLTFIYGL